MCFCKGEREKRASATHRRNYCEQSLFGGSFYPTYESLELESKVPRHLKKDLNFEKRKQILSNLH